MKRLLRSRVIRVLACIGILGLIVAGGIIEPRGSTGYAVFRLAYSLPSTRHAVLGFYSWSLKEYEGGYLPPRIDEFLIGRLAYCEGKPEETAIIDFQIRQGSDRWGAAASRAHEIYQGKMIANIMRRLEEMNVQDAVSAMVFIESLRRKNTIGKGGFSGMWNYSDNVFSLNRTAFDSAKKSFRTWWGDGSSWPSIRSNDPLSDSELAIHSGP